MSWELSEFGRRLSERRGIGELMQDLGHALAIGGDRVRMLGGGQPSHLPEIDALWRHRLEEIASQPGQLEAVLGNYQPPAGNQQFRESLAALFRREFGWDVSAGNVCITAGGQSAFFLLFNALAGQFSDGRYKRVLLPMLPEYIGYANQSVGGSIFTGVPPSIETIGEHEFKYHVDFDRIQIGPDIGAICVSRPTNPSSNVLTDAEIRRLAELAAAHQVPLLIDNAYGDPFPGVIFTETTPLWNQQIVLTLSLSKLGLPGTRTGIIVAREELVSHLMSMNSIVALANPNLGQALVAPLIESGEILRISREVIAPFYRAKSQQAIGWAHELFDSRIPYRLHRSEGAFFLWIWFEGLPITSRELYERLKARDVLIVPGSEFFFGLEPSDWRHRDECVRVSFSMPEQVVREGLAIIADEVARAYALTGA